MAMIHGKGGSVTWAGSGAVGAEITSWSLSATADTAESTNMASASQWKEFLAGFKGWTATVEVNWDSGDTTIEAMLGSGPAQLDLEMVDAGANLTGNAIGIGMDMTTDMNSQITISYSFQGSGALAYAAS